MTPRTPSSSQDSRGSRAGLVGGTVLAAATIAAYARTFAVPFLLDDIPSIAGNDSIRSLGSALLPPADSTSGGRPVLNLSLALNYAVGGDAPWGYHAVNLAVHVLAGLTLFGLVRRTMARRSGDRAARFTGFFCALLWLLHPLQTGAVTYLSQRAESLMGLFYLVTLYGLVRAAESDGNHAVRWRALAISSCALGMGTKEVMVSAPLIAFLFDRTFLAGSFQEAWRRRRFLYVGLAATWLILPFLVLSTHGRSGTAGFASGVSWWRYGLTQFPAITHYLRLCLWPHPLVLDYGGTLAPLSVALLPSVLVVTLLGAATIWAFARAPAFGFLGAGFFAVLAPSSSVIPVVTETVAEHRMYLPLIALAFLAAAGLGRLPVRAGAAIGGLVAVALFAGTWLRNEDYRSAERIWTTTVAAAPANERAHNNLGIVLAAAPGRQGEAIAQYEEALRLNPAYAEAHINLGLALAAVPGRLDEAIAHFEAALHLRPDNFLAHNNLAVALSGLPGRVDESVAHFAEALRLKPGFPDAHNNLGTVLAGQPGRLNDAIAQFEEALRLRPNYVQARKNLDLARSQLAGSPDAVIAQYEEALRRDPRDYLAHNGLGIALAGMPGRLNDAVAQFQEVVRLKPDFADGHNNLGLVLADLPGRLNDAVAHYEEALRLRPDYPEAHNNLGLALAELPGRLPEAITHFEEAVRLKPAYLHARLDLAEACARTPGQSGRAVAQLEEVLRQQPDNETARKLLKEIREAQP